MEGKTIGIGIAIIVVLLGGWLLFSRDGSPTSGTPGTNTGTTLGTMTVAYTSQGFSPKDITVPIGTTVTFANQTSDRMWVGSAMHPTHEVYDGTMTSEHCAAGYTGPAPFDQCTASASYSFTFTKAGTWRYHNHADASDFGSVTVTP